ncbi:hypothetical protein FRC01_013075 [Tulasnella sp. 417]|nr:hypothetical protein FRC01_013075 [Tulasnella sp. 417]
MNTTAYNFEQPITQRPEIPAKFGEDGGKFYYYYDQLADELDEDLTKRLKSQLDSLLIFAGLFAGVNSAFLALTLPMMSADPADDTNALLLQLVKGGNASISSETDLPSATFSPPPAIYPVNILFAVSLTCALMSSFLAVLGQQWLVYYRKRSGGGAEHQRKEQLRRQLGAQRWRLELVLDDVLPGLLQVGLVIFCISFILYLHTLSGSMSSAVAAIVGTGVAMTVAAALCATWDRMCPYQSPLSHLLCWTMDRLKPLHVAFAWVFMFLKTYLYKYLRTRRRCTQAHTKEGELSDVQVVHLPAEEHKQDIWNLAQEIAGRGLARIGRKEETDDDLIVASVKRVILTSEPTAALVHAAINICAINKDEILQQLLCDTGVFHRLHDLYRMFHRSAETQPTQLRALPDAAARSFAAAILHLALSVGTIMDLAHHKEQPPSITNSPEARPAVSPVLNQYFSHLVMYAKLGETWWDGDLKHVSHRLLLPFVIHPLLCFTWYCYMTERVRERIRRLIDSPPSRQLLVTLTFAVKAYVSCPTDPNVYSEGSIERYERLSRIFNVAKKSYRDPGGTPEVIVPSEVPFLSEALQLCTESVDQDDIDRSDVYRICLGVFRHACEVKRVSLLNVFAPMGRLVQNIEFDVRHAWAQRRDHQELREYKGQYAGILVRKLTRYMPDDETEELCKSLIGTLQYIREVATPQEPGHPENRVTLKLFRSVRARMQEGWYSNVGEGVKRECDKFEAWIDMGGCATIQPRSGAKLVFFHREMAL